MLIRLYVLDYGSLMSEIDVFGLQKYKNIYMLLAWIEIKVATVTDHLNLPLLLCNSTV